MLMLASGRNAIYRHSHIGALPCGCNMPTAFLPAVRASFNHSAASRLREGTMLMLAFGKNAIYIVIAGRSLTVEWWLAAIFGQKRSQLKTKIKNF